MIRKATLDDFQAFLKIMNSTFYSTEKKGSPKLNNIQGSCIKNFAKDDDAVKKFFELTIQKDELFIFEQDEEIIAYAIVGQERRVWKILDLMVENHHQGKGIGTQFVTFIIKNAKKARAKKIQLVCGFKGSDEFWKTMGFKEKGEGILEKIL